jgi:hypothetical protein
MALMLKARRAIMFKTGSTIPAEAKAGVIGLAP